MKAAGDPIRASCESVTRGYAATTAGAGGTPVPLVGVGGLIGANALMLRALANRYGIVWTPTDFAAFVTALGTGALLWFGLRYAAREMLKLIPGVGALVGGTVNALASFALTYGIGAAACKWLRSRQLGQVAPDEEVRAAFRAALSDGVRRARERFGKP